MSNERILIGKVDSRIMKNLGFQLDSTIYLRADFDLHLLGRTHNNHKSHYDRYGRYLKLIVEEPMWYGKTNDIPGYYLFVRKFGPDYVCVPIAEVDDHISILSFYIKENPQRVEKWIADRKLIPFRSNWQSHKYSS